MSIKISITNMVIFLPRRWYLCKLRNTYKYRQLNIQIICGKMFLVAILIAQIQIVITQVVSDAFAQTRSAETEVGGGSRARAKK